MISDQEEEKKQLKSKPWRIFKPQTTPLKWSETLNFESQACSYFMSPSPECSPLIASAIFSE